MTTDGPLTEIPPAPTVTDSVLLTDGPLDRPAAIPMSVLRTQAPGERISRRHQRRRLWKEELLAVAVMLLVLAATVAVLAAKWLGSGPSATSQRATMTYTYELGGAT